jgi:cytochrome c oxidase cbb3-type subunit 3
MLAVACGFAVALAGCSSATAPPASPEQTLYEQFCAVCHGVEGRSIEGMTSTPHLSSQGLLTVVDDTFLTESIRRGRPGANGRNRSGTKMSVFAADLGGPLSGEQIASIVAYIRRWQTEPGIALPEYRAIGDPEAGRTVYEQCLACHMQDGWSTLAPSLAGQTLQETASDAFMRYTVLNGRTGTTMPAFKLDEQQVGDLLTFVRSLYAPPESP